MAVQSAPRVVLMCGRCGKAILRAWRLIDGQRVCERCLLGRPNLPDPPSG